MTPPPRRAVVAWLLYDFANSAYVAVIPATVYSKYYALSVVGNERGEGDLWWGRAVALSMVIVAVASPPLGAIADHAGLRKRFLGVLTYLSVGATALMATVDPGDVVWGLVLAVVATVGFEAAIVYYNAYLPDLADESWRGRLSAYGFATGYAGSALALAAALPFALGGRYGGAFLTAAAIFGLLALPAMLFLPADRPGTLTLARAVRIGFTQTRATLRRAPDAPGSPSASSSPTSSSRTASTPSCSSRRCSPATRSASRPPRSSASTSSSSSRPSPGAWLWARPIDTWGPRFVVMVTLVQWCLVVLAAYFVTTKGQFYVVAILAGTGLGAVQAAARTFMANLIPQGPGGRAVRLLLALRQVGRGDGPPDLRRRVAPDRRQPARGHPRGRPHVRRRPRAAGARPGRRPGARRA